VLGSSGGEPDDTTNGGFTVVTQIPNLVIDFTNNQFIFNDAAPDENDYWQILDANFINVWEGNSPHAEASLPAGTYHVLNFGRMERIDNVQFN